VQRVLQLWNFWRSFGLEICKDWLSSESVVKLGLTDVKLMHGIKNLQQAIASIASRLTGKHNVASSMPGATYKPHLVDAELHRSLLYTY